MREKKQSPKRKMPARRKSEEKNQKSRNDAQSGTRNVADGFWGKTQKERDRLKAQYEVVPLSDLTPWKENPRIHDTAVPRLMKLIEEHGFVSLIVATPDGVVRSGHARLKALERLGWEEVPVEWKNFPTREAAEEYSMSDNRSSEWADWDKDLLAKLFKRRQNVDIKLLQNRTGFTKGQIQFGERTKDNGEPEEGTKTGKDREPWFSRSTKEAFKQDPKVFCRFVFSLLRMWRGAFLDKKVEAIWKEWENEAIEKAKAEKGGLKVKPKKVKLRKKGKKPTSGKSKAERLKASRTSR